MADTSPLLTPEEITASLQRHACTIALSGLHVCVQCGGVMWPCFASRALHTAAAYHALCARIEEWIDALEHKYRDTFTGPIGHDKWLLYELRALLPVAETKEPTDGE